MAEESKEDAEVGAAECGAAGADAAEPCHDPTAGRRCRLRRALAIALALGGIYLAIAYVIMPWDWRRYVARHPDLADAPRVTHTASGIPGDPLNLALVGQEADLVAAMSKAQWFAADRLGVASSAAIAADTVLRRPYATAPVSNLYLWGRKEDLAFEQPVGRDPRRRHHVRFWRTEEVDAEGRTIWVGAATFDRGVGLSRTTGQVTHHIDGNIDAERDHVVGTLQKAEAVASLDWLDDFHTQREGRNGGGDRWHTDGRLALVYLGTPRASRAQGE